MMRFSTPIPMMFILFFCSITCKETTRENGNYFFVFLNTNPDREKISDEEVQRLQKGHMTNIDRLHKAGKLVAAGPFDGGGGIFIFTAKSLEETKRYLETDPAINAGRYIIEIFPFAINSGSICSVGEKYEMVNYQFVRFKTNADVSLLNPDHLKFITKINDSGHVIIDGSFESGGGILILNMQSIEEAENMIHTHPLIEDGKIFSEIRPLWIAKETFCQN